MAEPGAMDRRRLGPVLAGQSRRDAPHPLVGDGAVPLHLGEPDGPVRLTQMKWNGTVSHEGMRSIAARLASENRTQATSIHRSRFGHSSASGRIEPVSHPA